MTIIHECSHCNSRTEEESIEDHFYLIICDACRNSSKAELDRRRHDIYGSAECREWFRKNKRHFWSDWF